jgi:quinol monooxygenase YgiN
MAVYRLARYEVRPEARADAERAMHELASYVRRELPDVTWTVYRDPHAPTRFVALSRADNPTADAGHRDTPGVKAFLAAITPLLAAPIEDSTCELVTSSDLAPRVREPKRTSGRPRRPR